MLGSDPLRSFQNKLPFFLLFFTWAAISNASYSKITIFTLQLSSFQLPVIQPLATAIKHHIQWSFCFLNFKLFLPTPEHVLYNNLQSFKTCDHFYQLGWFNLGQYLKVRFSTVISDLSKFCFEGEPKITNENKNLWNTPPPPQLLQLWGMNRLRVAQPCCCWLSCGKPAPT